MLTELYAQHAGDALRLAYLLTGDASLAEDLVQDAFVRLAGRLLHLRDRGAFAACLRQTIVNLARSHFRRKALERRFIERQTEPPPIGPPDADSRPHRHAQALDPLIDRATRLHPEGCPSMEEVASDLASWLAFSNEPVVLDVSEVRSRLAMIRASCHIATIAFMTVGSALVLSGSVLRGETGRGVALVAACVATGFAALVVAAPSLSRLEPSSASRHPLSAPSRRWPGQGSF